MTAAAAELPRHRYLTVYVGDGQLSVSTVEEEEIWIRDVGHQELLGRLTGMVE